MRYPFISKPCDFKNGLDKLQLPKWVPGMANICSQLQDTIFKPFNSQSNVEIHLQYTFPANSLLIPVPFLLRVDFQNGDHNLVPDVMWVPREEFFQPLQDQNRDEVSEQVIGASPSADEIQDELSPAQIIQKTSLFVLQYKNYITVLQLFLETIPQPLLEEQSLATRRENSGSWAAHQNAIRQLKAELLKIATRIDADLFEYSTQRNPYLAWREWNELDQFKKTIENLLQQLNSDSIRQHLQSLNKKLSSHAVLADIIGLEREVADDIFREPSYHESEEDCIHRHFEAVANSKGTKLNNQPIEKQLVSFGYTEQRATFIANKIRCNKLPKHHLSVLDFAHIFIQDMFKYDVLLTDTVADLPDRSRGFNTVYNEKTGGSGEEREIPCQIYSSSQQDTKNLQSFFTADNHSKESEDNFEYWYHGADDFGASNIVKYGIDLQRGTPAKDFSDGKGFYLSDGCSHARKWAKRRSTFQNMSAILQFKIPKSFWDEHRDGIVLSRKKEDDMKQWRDIIRYNRSGKKDAIEMKKLMMTVPFIMGPLSTDGLWETKKDDPDWPLPLKNSWRQLCICNELVGVEFDKFLVKIAFVDFQEEKRLIARTSLTMIQK